MVDVHCGGNNNTIGFKLPLKRVRWNRIIAKSTSWHPKHGDSVQQSQVLFRSVASAAPGHELLELMFMQ